MGDLVGDACPFCGASLSSVTRHEDGFYRVTCELCGATSPPDVGNRLSVAGWGRRPIEDALRAQVEALTARAEQAEAKLAAIAAMVARWDAEVADIDTADIAGQERSMSEICAGALAGAAAEVRDVLGEVGNG